MASLQIRDVDPLLLDRLKRIASKQRRTLGQQVLLVLEEYIRTQVEPRSGMVAIADELRRFWEGRERPRGKTTVDRTKDTRTERIQRILDEAS